MHSRYAGVVCAAALALACALAAPAQAAKGAWKVGAAKVDITPPKFDAAQDAKDFGNAPNCGPLSTYTGPRAFRFIEPYVDLNNNKRYDYGDPTTGTPPEPFCDANGDQRHEDVYLSGAVDSPAKTVHDPIDARAIAFSDGTSTYVVASVVSQGLFDEPYIAEMRQKAEDMTRGPGSPGITDMIVSANHNEGSPDTIGIYGGPQPKDPTDNVDVPAGLRSGIDEYYMTWMDGQVAKAATDAYHAMKPATLWARQVPTPDNVHVHLSKDFPTTYDKDLPNGEHAPAAIDPKVGILQARDSDGKPIATIMSLAAHNQETGQNNPSAISADWPGAFHDRLESKAGGRAMFLAAAIGSEEDPDTVPDTPIKSDSDYYKRADVVGQRFADYVAAQAPKAVQLPFGQPDLHRKTLYPPIENNVFKAAIVGGLFGKRPGYTNGQNTGPAGTDLKTFVNVLDLGPQFQFITDPGEAFPALMLGSPFGVDDATCPNRPNPGVPTWHSHAAFRFQMGLADDMIGYMKPPWAFFQPGVFTTDECDAQPDDPKGHPHKLETEGVGPTAGAMVANTLTDMLEAEGGDKTAAIGPGRFVTADGTVQKRPEGAVAIWLADKGATSLTAGKGRLIAIDGVTGFGKQAISGSARPMDFDGIDQTSSDITTRGMIQFGCNGAVTHRLYVDVYPALSAPAKISPATKGSIGVGCGAGIKGVGAPGNPSIGPPLVGVGAGGGADKGHACRDHKRPKSKLSRRTVRLKRGRVSVRGRSRDHGCHAKLAAVLVSVARVKGHRCRFLQANGRLGALRKCRRPVLLRAKGTRKWKLVTRAHLKRGHYRVLVRAVDRRGNRERPSRRNHLKTRVR